MDVDEEKVDDMVLALLYLTTFEDKPRFDPATKAKSVLLTEAGAKRSQELFEKYFTK